MYRIKMNVNRGPTFRFVNAIEYITVVYYDEIKKQRIKEHSNEVGGSNLLVYLAVTSKLRHVTTTERCREDLVTRHGSRGGTAGVLDRKDLTFAQALARRDLRKIERERLRLNFNFSFRNKLHHQFHQEFFFLIFITKRV